MIMEQFKYLIRRADAVIEALPYIQKFHDKFIVIKYGGSAMTDPALREDVLQDIILLKYIGMHPIIVHGGGPEINKYLKRKKIKVEFKHGLRVTDKAVLKAVVRVLGGKVNQQIVSAIKKLGGKAKGFYGKKGRVIRARKNWVREGKEYLDLGYIGQVTGVKYRYLSRWTKMDYIPILSPIGVGKQGQLYNINADHAAAGVARYLGAAKLILLTDVLGVLDKSGKLVSEVNTYRVRKMIAQGIISGGMIPKVKCGLHALKHGVGKVHIINGKVPHALLLELFTDHGIGTMVVK